MARVDRKPSRRSLTYEESKPPQMKKATKEVCKDVAAVLMWLATSSSEEEVDLRVSDDEF
jgi:hypothetical protein